MDGGRDRLYRTLLAGVAASCVFNLAACDASGDGPGGAAGGEPRQTDAPNSAVMVQDSAEVAAVVAAAQPVAASLMETLSGELRAAMEADGPVGAMEFCNVRALPLTRQVSEAQGMPVGRTSLRLRNPANRPDASAEEALAWFARRVRETGAIPGPLVQRRAGGDYRFYQPLATRPLCTRCHGTPDAMAQGVPQALARLYPEDEAVGYREGDWRGLLHVTVPAEQVTGSP